MLSKHLHLLLADDDEDDCLFFCEALEEFPSFPVLDIVHDGEDLMKFLQRNKRHLPDLLFLDLNMPRKNGFECLEEIRGNSHLKSLPVIIYSTSHDKKMIDRLYETGANHYIRKPNDFCQLKELLHRAITSTLKNKVIHPPKEDFAFGI